MNLFQRLFKKKRKPILYTGDLTWQEIKSGDPEPDNSPFLSIFILGPSFDNPIANQALDLDPDPLPSNDYGGGDFGGGGASGDWDSGSDNSSSGYDSGSSSDTGSSDSGSSE